MKMQIVFPLTVVLLLLVNTLLMLGTSNPFWSVMASSANSSGTANVTKALPSRMQAWAIRLRPGQDLQQELIRLVTQNKLKAVSVQTCVGSLIHVALRMANQPNITHMDGHFEICSLVGTVSEKGEPHLHMSVSDSTGRTIGGHVVGGCIVYTTAEIVVTELMDLVFVREVDPETTYDELVIKERRGQW